jgi:hypothetical protein
MKLVRLSKLCLRETYSRVRVDKNLSDFFLGNGLKQGVALSPFLINFALEYAIRIVQVNQDDIKWNGTHRFLFYVDDVNTLVVIVRVVQENAKSLVVVGKEFGLEGIGDKTKYMVLSRDQNEGRSRSKNLIIFPLKDGKCSNIWEHIKILFRKKLRADWIQKIVVIIGCRMFCLPGCYPKV